MSGYEISPDNLPLYASAHKKVYKQANRDAPYGKRNVPIVLDFKIAFCIAVRNTLYDLL